MENCRSQPSIRQEVPPPLRHKIVLFSKCILSRSWSVNLDTRNSIRRYVWLCCKLCDLRLAQFKQAKTCDSPFLTRKRQCGTRTSTQIYLEHLSLFSALQLSPFQLTCFSLVTLASGYIASSPKSLTELQTVHFPSYDLPTTHRHNVKHTVSGHEARSFRTAPTTKAYRSGGRWWIRRFPCWWWELPALHQSAF